MCLLCLLEKSAGYMSYHNAQIEPHISDRVHMHFHTN